MPEAAKSSITPKVVKSNQSVYINIVSEVDRITKHNSESRIARFILDPTVICTRLVSQSATGGIGVALDDFKYNQVPLETPNGVLKVFTLPNGDSYESGMLEVFIDGLSQIKPDDYSETSPTIFTLVEAPDADEVIRINYIKA